MRLTSVLRDWLVEMEWDDEVEVQDDEKFARFSTQYIVSGQPHRLFLEADEEIECFFIYLYTPYNASPDYADEMCRLLNRVNSVVRFGRLSFRDDGKSAPLQYKWALDLEGSEFAKKQIGNMLSSGGYALERYGQALMAVALMGLPAAEAWDKHVKPKEEQES
jgi:hypothetical protein